MGRLVTVLSEAFPQDTAYIRELGMAQAVCLLMDGKPVEAEFYVRDLVTVPEFAQRASFVKACARLESNQLGSAAELFDGLEKDESFPYRDGIRGLGSEIRRNPSIGTKSPGLAMVFSAVLPGSGQAWAGMTFDAVQNFAFCGMLGYGSFAAWEYERSRDHAPTVYILPAVLTAVFATFYTVNIINAWNSTQRSNQFARSRHLDGIMSRLEPALSDNAYLFRMTEMTATTTGGIR